jgi:hypothetical protein
MLINLLFHQYEVANVGKIRRTALVQQYSPSPERRGKGDLSPILMDGAIPAAPCGLHTREYLGQYPGGYCYTSLIH